MIDGHVNRSLPVPLVPAWLRWVGVAIIMVVIFYLSVVTAPPDQVMPKPDYLPLDKWRHFLAYGVLGYSLAYALIGSEYPTRYRVLVVFIVPFMYGIGLEFWQSLIPVRYFSVGDAIANAFGAVLSLTWFVLEPRLRFIPISLME